MGFYVVRASGGVDDVVEALYPLSDGGVLVVSERSEDSLQRLEPDGRLTMLTQPVDYNISGLAPFDGGYVVISRLNNRLYELDARLEPREDSIFAEFGADSVNAILWLNR